MFGFFELLNIDGSFLLLNVLIQLSLMASFAILFAKKFKNSAAARYAILYSAMLSLPILLGFSLLFQAGEQSLVYLPIEDSSFQTSTSNPCRTSRCEKVNGKYRPDIPTLTVCQCCNMRLMYSKSNM